MAENHNSDKPSAAVITDIDASSPNTLREVLKSDQHDLAESHNIDDVEKEPLIIVKKRTHNKTNKESRRFEARIQDEIRKNFQKFPKTALLTRAKFYLTPRNWLKFLTSKLMLYTLKTCIAVGITLAFSLVTEIDDYLSHYSYFSQTSVFQFDMTLAPGAAILFGIYTSIQMAIFGGLCTLALWSSSDYSWAMAMWLFFIVFLLNFFRNRTDVIWSIGWKVTQNAAVLIIIVGYRNGFDSFNEYTIFKYCLVWMLGVWTAVVVNVLVLPQTVYRKLGKEINACFDTMLEVLAFSVESYSQTDEEVRNVEDVLSKFDARIKLHLMNLMKINKNLETEVYLARLSPKQTKKVTLFVSRLFGLCRRMLESCQIQKYHLSEDAHRLVSMFETQLESLLLNDCKGRLCALKKIFKFKFIPRPTRIPLVIKTNIQQSIDIFDQQNVPAVVLGFSDEFNQEHNWRDIIYIHFYVYVAREFARELDAMTVYIQRSRRKFLRPYVPYIFILFFKERYKSIKHVFLYLYRLVRKVSKSPKPSNLEKVASNLARELYEYLKSDQFKLTLKISLAVLVVSIPQWISPWNHWYSNWRGEYAVLYTSLLIGPSFGDSYTDSLFRVLGTIVASIMSILTYVIFDKRLEPYNLAIFSMLLCFPCALLRLTGRPAGKLSIIAYVTYSSTVYAAYVQRNNPNYFTFWELVYKRLVVTLLTMLFVLVWDRALWPVLARNQARAKMSALLHAVSSLYGLCLDAIHLHDPIKLANFAVRAGHLETDIRSGMLRFESLLVVAGKEPSLHPLNDTLHQLILTELRNTFHHVMTMRVCSFKTHVKDELHHLVDDMLAIRKDLILHTLLILWVLGETVEKGSPLPQGIPGPQKLHKNLTKKLWRLKKGLTEEEVREGSVDVVRYFTFFLAMNFVARTADDMITVFVSCFGEKVTVKCSLVERKGRKGNVKREITKSKEHKDRL